MNYLFLIAASTMISLAIIPLMVRVAPRLGMMDEPDPRKVHVAATPRVGGWGIIIGALLPVLLIAPLDNLIQTYIFGSIVLLIFGALDDHSEMGHYTKFIGQFIAVVPVVTYADLYVHYLPFIDMELPGYIGRPFTAIALIGMINAINHSDGLDGLAGGESLASLAAIALLAYLAGDGNLAITITFGAIGGILGFLRYNTHPAMVFMGDGGSQFLGFTLGFLTVLLTQVINPDLSPSIALLILGVPIIDIVTVLWKRVSSKRNPFLATKNHIHHRLLERGFAHKESVVVIYTIHTFLVASGLWLRSTYDWIILVFYFTVAIFIFFFLSWSEQTGWKANKTDAHRVISWSINAVGESGILVWGPRRFLELAIPFYLVSVAVWLNNIPRDFGWVALALSVILALQALNVYPFRKSMRRSIIYTTAVFVIYLSILDRPTWLNEWVAYVEFSFYASIGLAIFLAIRFSPRRRKEEFNVTALDYLLLFVVAASLIFSQAAVDVGGFNVNVFIVVLCIILYGTELMLVERKKRADLLGKAAWLTLTIIALRGLGVLHFDISL
ncbi:MAG: undecaprenyl/decaprenyl-phosphate alpha-N-acetylglucosaminyl 1-phosphate transferase [Gammaproteobacteria bacterium]|nr:undecaprenyl/decaprenyl-phosphate alpha-N-acetylglucosaminyl 1-phosphate transferase [Gammaproteobacteria bacterium]